MSVLQSEIKLKPGQVVKSTVTEIRDYGVMVEIAPKTTALVHNTRLAHEHVSEVVEPVEAINCLFLFNLFARFLTLLNLA